MRTPTLLPRPTPEQLKAFKEALHFLHVAELKTICTQFSLPFQGKKGALIARIFHFVATGEVQQEAKIPRISCAERGKSYPLHPETLILKGAYKNDLETRLFFKKLIGEYFHFTAFGIDWLNARWLEGKPPTYKEFAQMWEQEYLRRKNQGSTPKQEWAYINFTQKSLRENPSLAKRELLALWDNERQKQLKIVTQFVSQLKS